MRQCEVPSCELRFYGKGLCRRHYQGWKRYGHNADVVEAHVGRICDVRDCGRPHYGLGYCKAHHRRVWRRGSVEPVDRTPQPRLRRNGYVYVWVDGRQRLEHRLIMEAATGRSLLPDENVHHVNGDRADNRLENLELWSKSQPSGQRVEDKLAWAMEILLRYGDAHIGQQLMSQIEEKAA